MVSSYRIQLYTGIYDLQLTNQQSAQKNQSVLHSVIII